MQLLYYNIGTAAIIIWLVITVISAISSAQKRSNQKRQAYSNLPPQYPRSPQESSQPYYSGNSQFAYDSSGTEVYSYSVPSEQLENFSPDKQAGGWQTFRQVHMPRREEWDSAKLEQQMSRYQQETDEEEHYYREEEFRRQTDVFEASIPSDSFYQPIPKEQVYEYVAEEYGEAGEEADHFYSSAEIRSGLQDEQDIARERAYRARHEEAFRHRQKGKTKFSGAFLEQKGTLKKAILLSEILGRPKSEQDTAAGL